MCFNKLLNAQWNVLWPTAKKKMHFPAKPKVRITMVNRDGVRQATLRGYRICTESGTAYRMVMWLEMPAKKSRWALEGGGLRG